MLDEFKISDFLKIRLENDETVIYVGKKRFMHCKFLLLSILADKIEILKELESIDETAESLDQVMEYPSITDIRIPPETEFWGHCSNLQAWHENYYDTRLLHKNLAFPLLRKLAKAGDKMAEEMLKEEVAKRFTSGHLTVKTYLIEEGYLDILNNAEFESLITGFKEQIKDPNFVMKDPRWASAWKNLAYKYKIKEHLEKALDSYKISLILDVSDAKTWINLGLLHEKMHSIKKAIESYRKATDLDPENKTAWKELERMVDLENEHEIAARNGWFLSGTIEIGVIKEEIESYKQAVEENMSMDNYDKVIEIAKDILDVHPNSQIAWQHLGMAYFHKKNHEKAVFLLQRAFLKMLENCVRENHFSRFFQTPQEQKSTIFYDESVRYFLERSS